MKSRIILLCCLALLLTGCGEEVQPTAQTTLPTEIPAVTEMLPPQTLPAEIPSEESVPIPTEPPVTEPPQTIPPETQSTAVWPETPSFVSLEEFRPYLYERVDTGNLEMEFWYNGLPGEVNAETVARMGNLLYVTCIPEGNLYRVKGDLDWLVAKYDYRNAGKPWGEAKDALQRTMQKLEGLYPADAPYKNE
jgi:hypothetical protein